MENRQQEAQTALFDSEAFREQFHYDGPLGVFCGEAGTDFFLWAPTAEKVSLRLYRNGTDGDAFRTCPSEKQEKGVFRCHFTENLDGTYYDYAVTADGQERITADPYAAACGVNGQRSMVLELGRTDPEGWDEDRAPAMPPENIIWETHVRDFSDSEDSGVRPEWRGKFLAFTEEHTTLNGDGIHPTCLNYLRYLGITHVQLMPVYDFGSVDEARPEGQYNWGYDPVNYNIPEGSYSTDPFRGEVRIRELKQAVQALHRNGFRVIMDVVYNHTYRLDSCLFRTVPRYYYRQNADGSASNGSGCGDDVASERSMCGRYILDSVLFWAREYHFDGFRFDLMGLLDVPLMNRIRSELDRIYGKNEKLLFGEPWAAGPTRTAPGTVLADKGSLERLADIGAFCDATRDAVKGSVMDAAGRGMVNGGPVSAELLQHCMEGWKASGHDLSVRSPLQTVSYLSSHDDWTLWDKLVCTMDPELRYSETAPELLRANRMAAAILFACRGNLFFLSGEEFARTKNGIKNSYNSPITVNRLDWQRAAGCRQLTEYYRGLIALRKLLPVLTDKRGNEESGEIRVTQPAADCCMAVLHDPSEQALWSELILLVNAGDRPAALRLPDAEGGWQPLIDGDSSLLWQTAAAVTGTVTAAPKSVSAWGRRTRLHTK